MAAIAAVSAVVGTAVQVYGDMREARAEKRAAKYRAKIAQQNSELAIEQSEMDAQAQQRAAAKIIGGMRAEYGAAGVSGGSVNDVIENSAVMAELDRQNILYEGKLKAMGYAQDAKLETQHAHYVGAGSNLAIASDILQGAGQVANYRGGPGTAPTPPGPEV